MLDLGKIGVFIGLFLLSSWSVVGAQQNPNKVLNGDYGVIGSINCSPDSVGFDPTNSFIRLGGGTNFSGQTQGVTSYDGNGNGTYVGEAQSVIHPNVSAGTFPIVRGEFSCLTTYQVNSDGTFTEQRNCDVTQVVGPRAGQSFTVVIDLEGRIYDRGKTVQLADTKPIIETVMWGNGDMGTRICSRTQAGEKIK